ncbi:hypothetical protein IW261DRAFT_1518638 [Armillaria novae-zelandiae]|uniref:Uncharacterized protein n=1 Tax=Armillaria novae-zelandiae TaxID=153914 RepID=A0AA39NL42_9AGAR|nr:hypothetical protein IW261DRAFT_1518638 [Armillaria novae-zelandiae]
MARPTASPWGPCSSSMMTMTMCHRLRHFPPPVGVSAFSPGQRHRANHFCSRCLCSRLHSPTPATSCYPPHPVPTSNRRLYDHFYPNLCRILTNDDPQGPPSLCLPPPLHAQVLWVNVPKKRYSVAPSSYPCHFPLKRSSMRKLFHHPTDR